MTDGTSPPPPPPPPSGAGDSGPPTGGPPPLPTIPAPPPLPEERPLHVPDDARSPEEREAGLDTIPVDADPVTDESEAAAEELMQRALQHITEQTRTYPCLQCGGELEFNIGEQRLKCPHCGNVQDIVENIDGEVLEQDFRAALAVLDSGALADARAQVSGEKEVVCQNCGGHTTFTGSLTATRCPYCATPIQRDDIHDAPTRLPVDGVLPFQVDRKTAEAKIDEWINSRWFAPNEFKKYATTGSFASVYTAYFTYDADTTTRYTGRRGDNYTVTVGHGENRRTEVRTRWRNVAGTVRNAFDDIPIMANEGLERKHVQALEPWPTHDAKAFSAEYVAGHLSRTYDHDVKECFEPARQRIETDIRHTIKRDIGGDHQRITSMGVHYNLLTYKHLLLPVWLLTVLYEQKPFQVFINGVTGEVQGQRPYSKLKIAIAVIVALVVIGVVVAVVQANQQPTPG